MQDELRKLKKQHAAYNESGAPFFNNVRRVFRESGYYYKNDKERFDTFADNLENAKTRRNSEQYKELIKTVRQLNENEKYTIAGDVNRAKRTDKQDYCMKLFVIKGLINEYLKHKAKDGVNKNTYDKLAAVEELNEYVSRKLEEFKPDYNKRETMIGNGTKYTKCSYKAWQEEFEKVPADAQIFGKQRSVLNCMGRIIARAQKDKTIPESSVKDRKAMRTKFGGGFLEIKPETKTAGKIL